VPDFRKSLAGCQGRFPQRAADGGMRPAAELIRESPRSHRVALVVDLCGHWNPRFVMRLIEPPAVQLYPDDIASDGRILALAPVSGAATGISLTVLVNWQAALQR
jgi:hypothetical protein